MSGAVHTTCPYCGVGCGVVAKADGTIGADPGHPSNLGRLCSKGAALGATLDDGGRLLAPMVEGRETGWDEALQLVAERFRETIAVHGPDSVAFYVSGQCLTEDYYVANKLMKGFIGSGNIDTNSRLCMASSVAGHVRAFGEDVVPGVYEDWDVADLVVLVGSNTAWCHPVLHQRLQAARLGRGTKVVVLDPRRTATADAADLHVGLAPGSDVALFNGLLSFLHRTGKIDSGWVARHTAGLAGALAVTGEQASVASVARACGVDAAVVQRFFEMFGATERVMTVFSQGVNQSSSGTDKVNAIVNCHLATGRIGRPGAGPFSVTGQPNAMGGREVGGLANQLAAHMGFDDAADRAALQAFWRSPGLAVRAGVEGGRVVRGRAGWAGQGAVDRCDQSGGEHARGRAGASGVVRLVRSLWCPIAGRPIRRCMRMSCCRRRGGGKRRDGHEFRAADFAAAGVSEGAGFGAADWWQFAEVGRRMGWAEAFSWPTPAAVFREHAALSGHANGGRRLFDISAMAELDDAGFEAMQPFRWPFPAGAGVEGGRLFGDGGFRTPDGRARFVPTRYQALAKRGLLLNTGRVRDQWHTMTRTGLVPSLMSHTPEPMLSMHPADASAGGSCRGR